MATVKMVSITWHTAAGIPQPVGQQYDVPDDQVDNLINLNFARRVDDLAPPPPEIPGRTA